MDWRGDTEHSGYQRLYHAISDLAGAPPKRAAVSPPKPKSGFTSRNGMVAAAVIAGVAAVAVAVNPIRQHFFVERYPVGETFRDCDACPEMVVVPAGSFVMGEVPDGSGSKRDGGPQHRVTIPEPFSVGVYGITFAEWDACAA